MHSAFDDLASVPRPAIRRMQRSAHRVALKVDVKQIQSELGVLLNAAGSVDTLVNNAVAIPGDDPQRIDGPRWREARDLKVFGYFNLCGACYAAMQNRSVGPRV
jgi:NADP-dependent 3-hydroxy acid dehydrogenase YdfG